MPPNHRSVTKTPHWECWPLGLAAIDAADWCRGSPRPFVKFCPSCGPEEPKRSRHAACRRYDRKTEMAVATGETAAALGPAAQARLPMIVGITWVPAATTVAPLGKSTTSSAAPANSAPNPKAALAAKFNPPKYRPSRRAPNRNSRSQAASAIIKPIAIASDRQALARKGNINAKRNYLGVAHLRDRS